MAGYGEDGAFAAYLAAQGVTLPSGSPAPAVLRERGSRYIDAVYGSKFCGSPTGGYEQERAWPRTGAMAFGSAIPDDVVPRAVVEASYRAAWLEAETPGWTSATINPNERVKREKVSVIETEYFDAAAGEIGNGMSNVDADIDGSLAPFLCLDEGGAFAGLWAIGN